MNVNQMTEKAVAERMGALMLENAKLQALLAASNAQVEALKKQVLAMDEEAMEGQSATNGDAREMAEGNGDDNKFVATAG